MKHLRLVLGMLACLTLATSVVSAQSIDAFLGFNTLITKTSPAGIPTLGGGLYPSFGADFTFLPHGLGLGGQVAWRAAQTAYTSEGVRPIYYDFNLTWNPSAPAAQVRPDFAVGIGAESLRFYQGVYTCGTFTGCSDYNSSNHFALHAGAGVKIFVHGHIFLRPSLDFYNIKNNNEYGIPAAWQVGLAIGYTLGPSS